jgi:pimeloyl-ACP methyl ester carboxylesterase
MQHRLFALPALLSLLVALVAPGAVSASTVTELAVTGGSEVKNVYLRMPQSGAPDQPLQVLIALHGMGGNGPEFVAPLTAQADQHGWILVAPTINYGDWTDPTQISREDPALIAWLSDYIAHLAQNTGTAVEPRVLLFGHSRGAQLSLRFTELHPEQVTGVAAVSAGTYTLPMALDSKGAEMGFPFGLAHIARDDGGIDFDAQEFGDVPVWVGVGAEDTNAGDVPHAWDAYIGKNRVERARTFTRALQILGVDVSLTVFPGAQHGLTDEMRNSALTALAQSEAAQNTRDQVLPSGA